MCFVFTMNGSRGNGGGRMTGRGARGRSSPYNHTPKCTNCGEAHYISECKQIQCARCCEFGHFAKVCQNEPKCFRCGLSGHFAKDCDYGRTPVSSDNSSGNNSASNVSSGSSASGSGACGEGPASSSVGGQTYADRLRRKPAASPGYRDCVNELISSLTSRTIQSLRPDLEDSLDRKFEDLERRVESFEASVSRQREVFAKERAALEEERAHREMLKGPLKGLFEHANELIKFLRPQPSASSTPVKSGSEQEKSVNRESENSDNVNLESEKSDNVNRESEKSDNVNMSEDEKKDGSVHGDDDQKSDSETKGEKKNDEGDVENDAAENELLGLEVD